jgi:hypothetical protein
MFSTAYLSLAAEKINFTQAAFGMILSQAASCNNFQCQNCRFRVFEVGYWNSKRY